MLNWRNKLHFLLIHVWIMMLPPFHCLFSHYYLSVVFVKRVLQRLFRGLLVNVDNIAILIWDTDPGFRTGSCQTFLCYVHQITFFYRIYSKKFGICFYLLSLRSTLLIVFFSFFILMRELFVVHKKNIKI